MSKKDYYELLGVSKNSDAKEIKSAFRKLAMKYHPDRNSGDKGAEKKFKEINEAYEVLKDEQKRAAYDRFGHEGVGGAARGHGPQGFGGDFQDISDIFSGVFRDFMGGGQRGGRQQQGRGSDLEHSMEILLEDAFHGKKRNVKYTTYMKCDDCSGTGSKEGGGVKRCTACHGRGTIHSQEGFFTVERTCPACGGSGVVIKNPCKSCNGQGRKEKQRSISIDIPPGVENGMKIRVMGEGEAGMRGAPSGDLYILVGVKEHRIYQRDGHNLHCSVPIKMTTAALGGEFTVPGLDKKTIKVKVPKGTQSDSILRVREKGMPHIRSKRHGDLFVQVVVEIPVNLTNKQKEILKEFESETNEESNPRSENFLDKVKSVFGGK